MRGCLFMSQTKQVLLERLISTNGIAVRNSAKDEAFWYTSGIPGPFYINTENIAGEHDADKVLENLKIILRSNHSKEIQSRSILETISQAVDKDKSYDASIDALLDYFLTHSPFKPSMISGGERRDWFFSVPIARKLKLPHIFLYKSEDHCVTDHEGKTIEIALRDQNVLHVADIINQASSYLKRWIPMLSNIGVEFSNTLTVAVRSQEGIDNLMKNNVSVISPIVVDRSLFTEAFNLGLITEFANNEIGLFYDSSKEWTRYFLSENNANCIKNMSLDTVKRDRIEFFKNADPYKLKSEFPGFFT
jgi:adenine/guanine phosphoribosyltransferase-like PRPP-binding protein